MRVIQRIAQSFGCNARNFAVHRPTVLWTVTSCFMQRRFAMQGSVGPGAGEGGARPTPPSKLRMMPLGCTNITSKAFASEVRIADLPILLYFHVENHPDVLHYTSTLMHQVELANKAAQSPGGPALASNDPPKLVVKLALVNCQDEPSLAKQFGVNEHMFPLIYFMYNSDALDRMVGLVPEAQVKDSIDAFLKYVQELPLNEGNDATAKPQRMDNDEENVMTLMQTAATKLRDTDFIKAEQLFRKAYSVAEAGVEAAKKRLGLHLKRMTPDTEAILKKDPHFNACPQSLAGLALSAMANKRQADAIAICAEIRAKYPWATKELKEVAESVCKIEILHVANYDAEKDSYINLLRTDELLNDPVKFYENNVKLVVAHYMERHVELALEECLRLVRAEPKMMAELKKAGVVDPSVTVVVKAGQQPSTPARKILFLIFEALGNSNEFVVDARKKLAAFMH